MPSLAVCCLDSFIAGLCKAVTQQVMGRPYNISRFFALKDQSFLSLLTDCKKYSFDTSDSSTVTVCVILRLHDERQLSYRTYG